jgi:hypothetical protein
LKWTEEIWQVSSTQWEALDEPIAWLGRLITEHAAHDPKAQRRMGACDVHRLTASAAV